ncbi:MAG: hypothetical protein QOE77_2320 [Blastocatellia bacterium]|jgi:hypothetical protein|nr:hypothetical protein [Blastocatellia bacterium]
MRVILVLTALVLGVSVWGISHFHGGTRGKVLEEWETANTTFRVRVTTYGEKALINPGAYYVFRSAPIGSESWREIMNLKFDDPVPIPREQIRFVNDRIGYVFMGEAFAVTTDSGYSWALWNAETELKDRVHVHSRSIKQVNIATDGAGSMHLHENPFQQGPPPTLRTQDYGQHWILEQGTQVPSANVQ